MCSRSKGFWIAVVASQLQFECRKMRLFERVFSMKIGAKTHVYRYKSMYRLFQQYRQVMSDCKSHGESDADVIFGVSRLCAKLFTKMCFFQSCAFCTKTWFLSLWAAAGLQILLENLSHICLRMLKKQGLLNRSSYFAIAIFVSKRSSKMSNFTTFPFTNPGRKNISNPACTVSDVIFCALSYGQTILPFLSKLICRIGLWTFFALCAKTVHPILDIISDSESAQNFTSSPSNSPGSKSNDRFLVPIFLFLERSIECASSNWLPGSPTTLTFFNIARFLPKQRLIQVGLGYRTSTQK